MRNRLWFFPTCVGCVAGWASQVAAHGAHPEVGHDQGTLHLLWHLMPVAALLTVVAAAVAGVWAWRTMIHRQPEPLTSDEVPPHDR